VSDDVAAIARKLTKSQRLGLLAAEEGGLTETATRRCILISAEPRLADYSFRPARLTPLGAAVRQFLLDQADETRKGHS
jgi:hypothetical protein